MSIIHTAELCDVNPFVYLAQLHRHADQLKEDPWHWMPGTIATRLNVPAHLSKFLSAFVRHRHS